MTAHRSGLTSPGALAPVLVSELTCAMVIGVDARRYRALVLARGIPNRREGHLTFTRADSWLAFIGTMADEPQVESDDVDVLALLGRTRTA